MKSHAPCLTAALAIILTSGVVQAQDDDDDFNFLAYLSGAQEVVPPDSPATPSPGVSTQGAGVFAMRAFPDLSAANFRLAVRNMTGVTQAHLHCGRAGQNGPVVVPLMQPNDQGADMSGVLGQGRITNEHIVESASGCEQIIGRPVRNIASLVAAAFEGLIYANVHTVANPAGEIRGQVIPTGDDDLDDDLDDDDFFPDARR